MTCFIVTHWDLLSLSSCDCAVGALWKQYQHSGKHDVLKTSSSRGGCEVSQTWIQSIVLLEQQNTIGFPPFPSRTVAEFSLSILFRHQETFFLHLWSLYFSLFATFLHFHIFSIQALLLKVGQLMGSCGHTWSAKEKRGFLFLWFLLLDAHFFLQPPGGSISSVWLLPCCWHSELHFWLRLSGVGWHSLRGDRLIKMMTSTVAIVVTGCQGLFSNGPKYPPREVEHSFLSCSRKSLLVVIAPAFDWTGFILLKAPEQTPTLIHFLTALHLF